MRTHRSLLDEHGDLDSFRTGQVAPCSNLFDSRWVKSMHLLLMTAVPTMHAHPLTWVIPAYLLLQFSVRLHALLVKAGPKQLTGVHL